jgi:NAD(P)-dependent dehydrogenase (short-subunit alcohol dehydrogenase family)
MNKVKKYALVTSSTNGIGKVIGKMLLKSGYYVFFNYSKNENNRSILEQEIGDFKGCYSMIKADLSDFSNIEVLQREVGKVTNRLDCIMLNTGITNRTGFDKITAMEWDIIINTNLSIPFFIVQSFSQIIQNNGRIIFIGSLLGKIPHAISIPYSVSKAGLHMLAKSLVKVFKNRGITVNVIAPGFIETDWHLSKSEDVRSNIEKKIALSHFGLPEDVAQMCMSVIENQYINGAVIDIDGGYDME